MPASNGNIVWIAAMPTIVLLVLAAVAVSGPVSVPHTFTPGTTADANAVNENFDQLETAVNENDERLTDVEAQLGGSRIVWGTVNANLDIMAGAGFTVSSGGPDVYQIDFDEPFGGAFAITITPFFPAVRSQLVEWYTDDFDTVSFSFSNASGSTTTSRFSFVAVGPR